MQASEFLPLLYYIYIFFPCSKGENLYHFLIALFLDDLETFLAKNENLRQKRCFQFFHCELSIYM
jgi:hypothetical protein